jgi:putative Mg2+ transporter-C (MgtC) family protein
MLGNAEVIGRIAVGAALGGVIGYERDRHRRPVGLRTHLIVAMAAATFMVISSQFVYWQHYGKDDLTRSASRRRSSRRSGSLPVAPSCERGFPSKGSRPPPASGS